MKNTIKLISLIVILLLSVSSLIACGGGGESDDEGWKPTGADVTLSAKDQESDFVFLFAADDSAAESAAKLLMSKLADKGFSSPDNAYAIGTMSGDKEIIFGNSDAKASVEAAKLLAEKATSAEDFNWVFYYYDGKLAIVASSAKAYEFAIESLFAKYLSGDKLVIKDNLNEHGVKTYEEYEREIAEREKAENDARKAQNAVLLEALTPSYQSQREEFATIKGTWSKYLDPDASTNPEIYLFGQYTEDITTIKKSTWAAAPTTPVSTHPRILITEESLPLIRKALREEDPTFDYFLNTLRDATLDKEGILPEAKDQGVNATVNNNNIHNWDAYYLEVIQAKALAYLLYEDDYYGYQAIYYLKNFIKSLEIVKIASDQCRQYGYVMYVAALVYDWCYPLLDDVDKTQIIAGVENCICRGKNQIDVKMEVGFPPHVAGSVNGHHSEYQVLRDYLAFSIAIYDENQSWWNYVASRVYNDYLTVRNYYFQSGVTQQGTGYATARHICDLYSGWILESATGTNPYVGMENTVRGMLGYEFKPGYIFNDGDGTGDSKTSSSFASMAYITAYLYGDEGMLAQADYVQAGKVIRYGYSGLSATSYVALRGLCDIEPAESRYENMELIQYNGAPLGQYIVRESWDSDSSAAVFMRIKERSTYNHEHCDTGTFEIYYKGMLTSDGGVYNHYGHVHTQYFHQATISHNGLIIFNPSLKNEDKGYYSGGQEKFSGSCSNLETWLENETLKTATVIGRQHAYNEDGTPLYAYIGGDITDAYHDTTVSFVSRRMLTVYTGDPDYPMVFFVFDDITAKNRSYEKRFLLQISSPEEPTITVDSNDNDIIITENGEGRLVLTSLSNNVKFNAIGGRVYDANNKYDPVNSNNYVINGTHVVPNNNTGDDGHWGRVEIISTKADRDGTFMNVIYVTDKGNEKMQDVIGLNGKTGVEGGVFDDRIAAVFATDRGGAKNELKFKATGGKSISYYVSGVAAGQWKVTVDGNDCGTYTATEEGGLLTFTAPAGSVVITPVN